MKKELNYVDASAFEAIIIKSGLETKVQSGFVKVSGPKGRNLYVAKTKTVGRVDLSGFTVDLPGIHTLDQDEAFGNVHQQLDFTQPAEDILATFSLVLDHMKSLPALDVLPRKKPVGKKSEAIGWTTIA